MDIDDRFASVFMDEPLSNYQQWATKVLRHFVIFEYLRQISFLISTILPLPPSQC